MESHRTDAQVELSAAAPFDGPSWPGAGVATATSSGRRRVSDGTRRRLRRQHRLGWLLLAGLAVFLGGIAWVAITAVMARGELDRLRGDLSGVRTAISAGNVDDARRIAADLSVHARRARRLTSGPAWAVGAAVPWVGGPLQTIRTITDGADQLASSAVPDLVQMSTELDPRRLLVAGGQIDVTDLAQAAPAVHDAALSAQHVSLRVSQLPPHTWLPIVDRARAELDTKLTDLTAALTGVDRATTVLPGMLGADRPKRYFVGFENEAEARGLGGLPGSFAIAVVDRGRISFTHFEPDETLRGVSGTLPPGPDYAARYGSTGLDIFQNSTISPNFPYVAKIWASMWQQKSGEQVDGAVAIDPTALSYFLRVTGPATLPDGSLASADNVVDLTQNAAYARFDADVAGRKQYLLDIAQAVQKRILATGSGAADLVKAAGRAAGERRLLVWSADQAVQATLAPTAVSGQLPSGSGPLTALTVTNAAGTKLDYYLDRNVSYVRSGCGARRRVTVTVTLTNTAPASGLPSYVTTRMDAPSYPTKPGDDRLLVSLYATQGAVLQRMSVDNASAAVRASQEVGHPVFTADLELARGTSRTLVYQLSEPGVPGPVTVVKQPLVRPIVETVTDQACRQ